MKLAYNYKDKIFWIHNFLSYDMYKSIHSVIIKNRKKINVSAVKDWNKTLIGDYEPIMKKDIFSDMFPDNFFNQFNILLKHQPFLNLVNKKINYGIHKMSYDSGITWHHDGAYSAAATYYINNRWNQNWGGELMWNTEDAAGYFPVIGNSLVLMKTPVRHKVNKILSKNVSRYSIQGFITQ